MATSYKVLGQTQGTSSLSTYTTVYTVPSGATSGAIISMISACNTSTTNFRFRVALSTTTTPSSANWIVYNSYVAGEDTSFINVNLTMDTTYKHLIISSESNSLSFTVCGSEM
jgi:hypothetical protein